MYPRAFCRPPFVLGFLTVGMLVWPLRSVSAGDCLSKPEGFELRSDRVSWNMSIGANSECLQGLRGRTMLIDTVRIVEPPKHGTLTISGPAFRYRAPETASVDSFKLEVSGENRRIRGASDIVVNVSVR